MDSAQRSDPEVRGGKPLRVAMIGHGFMGQAHSQAWRNVGASFDVPSVRLQVLAGRDPERTASSAARYGWQESSTDWRSVLARSDIDIVDICTPGHLHTEMAQAALEAGKHVLLEKPLANSLAEAQQLTDTAARAQARGVRSMVGFNYRRIPALALARQHLAEGRLGTVRQVRIAYLQDWLADAGAPMTWRLSSETAGSGALGDIASHAVDQVMFLLPGDPVTEVAGRLATFVPRRSGPDGLQDVTVDDAAWLTLGLASGAVASVEVSRVATGRKNALRIEVFGAAGALAFDLERLNELEICDAPGSPDQGFRRVLVTEPGHPYLSGWWPTGHTLGWEHTFTHEVADFLAAIRDGSAAEPSFAAGLEVQRVLDAAALSARSGSRLVPVEGTKTPETTEERIG